MRIYEILNIECELGWRVLVTIFGGWIMDIALRNLRTGPSSSVGGARINSGSGEGAKDSLPPAAEFKYCLNDVIVSSLISMFLST